jgi:hypothetical protein
MVRYLMCLAFVSGCWQESSGWCEGCGGVTTDTGSSATFTGTVPVGTCPSGWCNDADDCSLDICEELEEGGYECANLADPRRVGSPCPEGNPDWYVGTCSAAGVCVRED